MEKVRLGVLGSRFVAHLHLSNYKDLIGKTMEVVAVAARTEESARNFAMTFDIPKIYTDYRKLVEDPEVDVVDVCLPTDLHKEAIIAAAQAGKHVICEKPLTGYFGKELEEERVGDRVPRETMLQEAMKNCRDVRTAVEANRIRFCYAEDWVYAPAFTKLKRLVEVSGGLVMDIRAEESHSGSHAAYSRRWKTSGGGSLARLGSHPIGAVLHLKHFEGQIRDGRPIRARSVTAEVGRHTQIPSYQSMSRKWLVSDWQDVEDWSCLIIEFEDSTKAVIFASDGVLGGTRNTMQVYLSNAVVYANMNPNRALEVYAPDAAVFGDEYLVEKLETKAGWSFPSPQEDWDRGYPQELEDFIEAIRNDRDPLSGLDLAEEVVDVIYSGYLSAEKGQRVEVTPLLGREAKGPE
ncbi:MAG: Gfo/Idh/MocA family oxidoreductase [Deltaproteobacteria bacterium]|nr:Gfo/Idh/MocA family oxidoreductase [Deltaproteobacteria bacterium]